MSAQTGGSRQEQLLGTANGPQHDRDLTEALNRLLATHK
jgi:hypothetical protein